MPMCLQSVTQSSLPHGHYLLPIHIWLDKCKISDRVRLHPIVLRPLWQPVAIRNASGNGGGVILGWMPLVRQLCRATCSSAYSPLSGEEPPRP
jgi:hypothetical protein